MDLIRNLSGLVSPAKTKLGFVPTMGALREGHVSLIERSLKKNSHTVVSIFVNPTQFNSPSDFQNYPNTMEKDLEICKGLGVTQVFLPTPELIYPNGYRTSIFPYQNTQGEKILCDRFRPGHFQGVLTVVNILFNLVKPSRAYFGLKDAQQYVYIKNMVEDFHLPIQIIPVETIRDKSDGLALSSRNLRLSNSDRDLASNIPMVLKNISQNKLNPEEGIRILENKRIKVEYLEVRTFPELKIVEYGQFQAGQRLFFAGYVGGIRLIDNMEILNP